MRRNYSHFLTVLLLCCGCAGQSKQEQNASTVQEDSLQAVATPVEADSTAKHIGTFLTKELQADLPAMTTEDRRFSFYAVDLNGDGNTEYLVKPESRYFCGTGGCTFFLLDSNYSLHTKFTVTTPPIYVVAHKTNSWHDLALEADRDESGKVKNYIYLSYQQDGRRYPGNPSLISKSETAPEGIISTCWPSGEQQTMHSF
ncbi:hypothetical protein [Sphingobacterium deserti]|uniref:Uncharacterized protein n=1 Tax=Sphingobacterium deserti TaxID=1229276 RepID=A0A0B8T6H1_9SPHI|nr:hypothetical protein [Sphingobacterium deserti]KGE12815.1 hypothetical protein DI53_3409 [Sphingobacterium deserti]